MHKEVHETKTTPHTLNSIAGGFAGGGETNSARKKYACTVMHVSEDIANIREQDLNPVSFSKRDAIGIMAHKNDPLVIMVQSGTGV